MERLICSVELTYRDPGENGPALTAGLRPVEAGANTYVLGALAELTTEDAMASGSFTAGSGDSINISTAAAGTTTVTATNVTGPPPTPPTTATYTWAGTKPEFINQARDEKNHLNTPGHTVTISFDGNKITKIDSEQTKGA